MTQLATVYNFQISQTMLKTFCTTLMMILHQTVDDWFDYMPRRPDLRTFIGFSHTICRLKWDIPLIVIWDECQYCYDFGLEEAGDVVIIWYDCRDICRDGRKNLAVLDETVLELLIDGLHTKHRHIQHNGFRTETSALTKTLCYRFARKQWFNWSGPGI